MKFPSHKGKFALVIIYALVVFVAPIFTIATYDPAKVIGMIAKFVSEKDDQFFRNYIGLLQEQNVEEAYGLLSPEAQAVVTEEVMKELASREFSKLTTNITVVGANLKYVKGESPRTNYSMTYEVASNDSDPEKKYVGINIGARDLGQGIKIDSVKAVYYPQSLKDTSKFSFPKPDLTMILAILAPLFVMYTAFRYLIKATNPNWWVLLMIILLCFRFVIQPDGMFTVNFGFGGVIGLVDVFGPWAWDPFIPIGAAIYYIFRKKWEGGIATLPTPVAQPQ